MACLVTTGLLLTRGESERARQEEVVQFVREFSVALSSYDYRHLDRDLARVRAMGAGHFRYQYEEILGGEAFRQALEENQAVATAEVVEGPFVAALDEQQARVYTVLEQRIQGRSPPEPTTRRVLVETMLVRTVNGWKVDWVVLS